jgi:hypothetical protein
MKNILTIAALLIALSASAQISFKKVDYRETIVIKADTMSVEQAFAHLDYITQGNMWYFNRVVEKDGKSYLRYGVPLFKRSTYVAVNGKYRRIKKASI